MKAIDDHTLEVTLSEPVPYFYKLLVHPSTSPVPKAAIEKFGEKWTQLGNIVTNGAYTLKDWVVNERIVLERSPTYWNNAKTVINPGNLFCLLLLKLPMSTATVVVKST